MSMVKLAVVVLATMALVAAGELRADMVMDGLVAYWSMDAATIVGTSVKDIIGGNDGEMVGNPQVVPGRFGEALKFSGEDSLDVAGTDALNFNGKTAMTVAAWANAGSDDPVIGVVAGCCGSIVAQRDANAWALRYDGRNAGLEMEFIAQPGWQGDGGFGAPRIAAGEWHYLTGVIDVDMMRFYLDGILTMEQSYGGPMAADGPETDIGKAADGGFVGLIDEVSIYERALSAEDILQNLESGGTPVESQGKLATYWGVVKALP